MLHAVSLLTAVLGEMSTVVLRFLFFVFCFVQVPVDHAVPLRERGVEVRMEFGGTEIAVSCYKQHDGDKLLDAKVRMMSFVGKGIEGHGFCGRYTRCHVIMNHGLDTTMPSIIALIAHS